MKLKKTNFDKVKIGDECMFKNMFGEIIFCQKVGKDRIFYKKDKIYTGQFHSCYLIDGLDIIERFFARFQWYLNRRYDNEKK